MALIELQAGLFFCPKPSNTELQKSLNAAIRDLNEVMTLDLRPMDDMNARVLAGDREAFEANGKQLFLLYSETRPFSDSAESSLHIMIQDEYAHCAALHIGPELTEPTREQTRFVWTWLVKFVEELSRRMKPLVTQINGVDEDGPGHLVSAKTLRASLPQFFTPYTYVDQSLADDLPRQLEQAGAYRVSRVGSGWGFQLVEDLHQQPPRAVLNVLRTALGSKKPYRHTPIGED